MVGGSGYKWVRRYGIALILAAYTWNPLVGLLAFVAFCLPYGDDEPWYINPITAAAHSIISLPIGFGILNLVTLGVVLLCMNPLSKRVNWKVCEFLMGLSVGMQFL